jgi:hypothetical protein
MHLLLAKQIVHIAAMAAMPVAGGIAFIKGDMPERLGAGACLGVMVLTELVFGLAPHLGYTITASLPYIDLVSSLVLSSIFLYLAVRYGSLWLAASMVIQASELYFAREYIDAERPNYTLYSFEINLICVVVFSFLGAAAIWSWRARTRRRRDDAKREEAANRRQEAWSHQYETLLAGRLAEVAAPAPVRNGRAHLTIEPQLP